jgi:hypothetical protein
MTKKTLFSRKELFGISSGTRAEFLRNDLFFFDQNTRQQRFPEIHKCFTAVEFFTLAGIISEREDSLVRKSFFCQPGLGLIKKE